MSFLEAWADSKVISYLIWYSVHIPICTKTSSCIYLYLVGYTHTYIFTHMYTYIYSVFLPITLFIHCYLFFLSVIMWEILTCAKCYQKEFSHKFSNFLWVFIFHCLCINTYLCSNMAKDNISLLGIYVDIILIFTYFIHIYKWLYEDGDEYILIFSHLCLVCKVYPHIFHFLSQLPCGSAAILTPAVR